MEALVDLSVAEGDVMLLDGTAVGTVGDTEGGVSSMLN
jgi:hypothetical protein